MACPDQPLDPKILNVPSLSCLINPEALILSPETNVPVNWSSSLSMTFPLLDKILPTIASPFCPIIPYIPFSRRGPHCSSSTFSFIVSLAIESIKTLSSAVPTFSASVNSGFKPVS